MTTRAILTTLILSLLLLNGCDRDSQTNSASNGSTQQPATPQRLSLQLTPITPLLPRLRTHLAVDSRGNLYWFQESEPQPAGGDMVYAMGDSGVPQSIPALSLPSLLAASGRTDVKPASCALRAMAAGPDDQLYVFFTGGSGRATIAFLARYDPRSRRV